ncbi:hypothetical protein CASFOL_009660 [Castilleja foliolosa]|uniref:Uncharacterized protein n=1 Tax=Castilleja foliolosa TaxID=1961234 RepID=A0ABD3DQG5_9LAMI
MPLRRSKSETHIDIINPDMDYSLEKKMSLTSPPAEEEVGYKSKTEDISNPSLMVVSPSYLTFTIQSKASVILENLISLSMDVNLKMKVSNVTYVAALSMTCLFVSSENVAHGIKFSKRSLKWVVYAAIWIVLSAAVTPLEGRNTSPDSLIGNSCRSVSTTYFRYHAILCANTFAVKPKFT